MTRADTDTVIPDRFRKAEENLINEEYKVFKIGNPSGQSTDGKVFSREQ